MSWFSGRKTTSPIEKKVLSEGQIQLADKLADLKGITRDEVLAEAYRRADKILKTAR